MWLGWQRLHPISEQIILDEMCVVGRGIGPSQRGFSERQVVLLNLISFLP